MKTAFFDCQFGAAGDMLCAALIDAGLPPDAWLRAVKAIALPEGSFSVEIKSTHRRSIASKKVDVICKEEHIERHLDEVCHIIEKSDINDSVKSLSKRIFENLAEAEGKVHGLPATAVHFHEVGAIDAIVDIVGFAIAYEMLGIERSIVSALPLGSGCVQSEHGLIPVPGPAVINLLSAAGASTRHSEISFECLTPTGAAILTTIACAWGRPPAFSRIDATGWGAGTKYDTVWPNVVRAIVGHTDEARSASQRYEHEVIDSQLGAAMQSQKFQKETISVVEANIDDGNPQALAFTVERLLSAGALDVAVLPAVMKKGRSGHLLSVICQPQDTTRFQEMIIAETTSIGVRSYLASRLLAERQWKEVELSAGKVRIKLAYDKQGNLVNEQPEFADCAAYAERHSLPVKEVISQALASWLTLKAKTGQK